MILAIRQATISLKAVPVMCGTALRNKGIQPVMDAVVHFLPSPEDIPPVRGINPLTGQEEIRLSNDKEPLAALAFKVMQDEGRKLTYLRVYSGYLQTGEDIYNASIGKKEKILPFFDLCIFYFSPWYKMYQSLYQFYVQ
jgi:elongation factor G